MPIYLGTTKLYNPPFGTTPVDKVFKGTEPVFARMTLNFDEQGGGAVSNKTVYYGDTYGTLPAPSRSNYDFNGWWTASSGGSNITSSSIVNDVDDHTLYAQWLADPVLIATDIQFEEATQNELVYLVTNNNPFSVTLYFEATDTDPDLHSITLTAYETNYAVITNLNAGTLYQTYFKMVADGNQSAIINKQNTTQSAGPTDWVFVGTSGTYNATVNYAPPPTSCPSTSVVDTWLTNNYPVGNYSTGYKIRVYVVTKFGTVCGYYYYEAQ